MSILRCDHCAALIDTDLHPEAWNEEWNAWFCENCMPEEEDEEDD